jgi:membrane dipeptidase
MSTHNVDARRKKLTLGFNVPVRVILAVFSLCAICFGQSPPTFVMDGHVHIINRQLYLGGDISDHYKDGQVDLPRIRKGGINAIFFSLFTSDSYYPNRFELKQTMILMDLALRQIRKNQDQIEIARNASDIERIYKSGKIAAFLHLEGSFDLDGDLGVLRDLYRLGLRSAMFVAHNTDTNFADSCCSPPKWNGITAHGIELVHEMNRLGMVIDVAHASDATMRQVAAASSDPIIYSHGGSMSIVKVPRNITDETAKIIAAKGGVIGLQFGNGFNNPKYHDWLESHRESRPAPLFTSSAPLLASLQAVNDKEAKLYPPVPEDVPEELRMPVYQLVAVLDHWIEVVGEDHVSLGSDFDGWLPVPKDMHDIGDYQLLITAMRRHGYSDERVRKIAGLNLLRVIRQVTQKQQPVR